MTNQQMRELARQIYARYRTALLSKKYYAHRLQSFEIANIVVEVTIAVTSSGTIASWYVWKDAAGALAWQHLGMITAVFALIKPFLALTSKIERSANLHASYALLFNELKSLVEDMRVEQTISPDMVTRFHNARERMTGMVSKEEAKPSERLAKRYFEEVNREIPAIELWMPPE